MHFDDALDKHLYFEQFATVWNSSERVFRVAVRLRMTTVEVKLLAQKARKMGFKLKQMRKAGTQLNRASVPAGTWELKARLG